MIGEGEFISKFGPITIEINHRWESYSARCFLNLPQNHPEISDKTNAAIARDSISYLIV